MRRLKVKRYYKNVYEKISGNLRELTIEKLELKNRKKIRHEFLEKTKKFTINNEHPFSVHMLLCKRDLEMAVCSAMAFNKVMEDGMRFYFHDDGSLDINDTKFIQKHLPGIKVILRKEADEKAEKELKAYPNILEYRKNQIMALKLIDVRLWGQGDRICYVDSDVLFLKKPTFFIDALSGKNPKNYFNKDIETVYVQTPEEIESFMHFKPLEKCNAGLWVMHKQDINFNIIEEWLGNPGFEKNLKRYTLDQTFISMLATISTHGVDYLPKEYDVNFYRQMTKSASKHYVGAIRNGYELEGLNFLLNKKYFEFKD